MGNLWQIHVAPQAFLSTAESAEHSEMFFLNTNYHELPRIFHKLLLSVQSIKSVVKEKHTCSGYLSAVKKPWSNKKPRIQRT